MAQESRPPRKVPPVTRDPVDRFEQVLQATSAARAALAPASLEPLMPAGAAEPSPAQLSDIATRVAENTGMTKAQAVPLVSNAVQGQSTPQAKAQAVSDAAMGAALAGSVELSDPVMLSGWPRMIFAAAFMAAVGGCIGCLNSLGEGPRSQEAAEAALAAIGVLALIGVLVLVMGYKTVNIKSGSSGGSS